jgi:hypothetical protein
MNNPFLKMIGGEQPAPEVQVKWKFNKIEGKNQWTFRGGEDFPYFALLKERGEYCLAGVIQKVLGISSLRPSVRIYL